MNSSDSNNNNDSNDDDEDNYYWTVGVFFSSMFNKIYIYIYPQMKKKYKQNFLMFIDII